MKSCPKCAWQGREIEQLAAICWLIGGKCEKCGFIPEQEQVSHPQHYGGEDNPYEAIKVIEAWSLGFNLGNTLKYISRHEHKGVALQDLKKAQWYLNREIELLEKATPKAEKAKR